MVIEFVDSCSRSFTFRQEDNVKRYVNGQSDFSSYQMAIISCPIDTFLMRAVTHTLGDTKNKGRRRDCDTSPMIFISYFVDGNYFTTLRAVLLPSV